MPIERYALLIALICLTACSAASPLAVEDARVRALIPGQDKTVAYLNVHNPGRDAIVLVGAEAPHARAIEFHTTGREGDVMRMRRLSEVEIPPGGDVRFEPGGNHLMLFGVTSLEEHNDIRLIFADGRSQVVSFRRIAPGGQ
ncbi:MAG: copper chaperone PCu(A)C [Pseudomonadales bacterium]|jgi:copper(I)-binding protein